MHGRTRTRRPIRFRSTPGPIAATRPQQSVPWMNGNGVGALHPPSSLASRVLFLGLAVPRVSVVTVEEYQPRRVLISVLFTPAARTWSRTSPGPGTGRGTSLYSSLSRPPLPTVTTAFIVAARPSRSKRSGREDRLSPDDTEAVVCGHSGLFRTGGRPDQPQGIWDDPGAPSRSGVTMSLPVPYVHGARPERSTPVGRVARLPHPRTGAGGSPAGRTSEGFATMVVSDACIAAGLDRMARRRRCRPFAGRRQGRLAQSPGRARLPDPARVLPHDRRLRWRRSRRAGRRPAGRPTRRPSLDEAARSRAGRTRWSAARWRPPVAAASPTRSIGWPARRSAATRTSRCGSRSARRASPRTAPTASFAGLHDTELGLTADEVAPAVLRCWASLWSDRAIGYRTRRGLALDGGAMAVVVQALVPAAGRGGRLHPPSRHADAPTRCSSTPRPGLGEAMVSGLVTPDTIVIDKADRTRGRVHAGRSGGGPALADDALAELVGLCLDVERAFGAPVDIEAALARRRLVSPPGPTDHDTLRCDRDRRRDRPPTSRSPGSTPHDAELTWEWDDMHMPMAVTPLARRLRHILIGAGFAYGYERLERAVRGPGPGLERLCLLRRRHGRPRGRAGRGATSATPRPGARRSRSTDAYWRDRRVPELREIYDWVAARAGRDGMPADDLAAVWDEVWHASAAAGRSISTRSAGRTRSSTTWPTCTNRS